jgi:copper chaperone
MKTILRSKDLTCPSCVQKIERVLKGLDGVQNATVHFTTGRIEVQHDPDRASSDDLIAAVRSTGYQPTARPV